MMGPFYAGSFFIWTMLIFLYNFFLILPSVAGFLVKFHPEQGLPTFGSLWTTMANGIVVAQMSRPPCTQTEN